MPRFPRYNEKTNYLHVMTQGHNKSYIFDKSEDIKYYIKLMYELIKETNIAIIAYCIMSNHTHMLIKVSNMEEVSQYFHKLNLKYATYFNKKYKRVGYVFRDRYKSQEIYSEGQLHTCMKYIYDNPVKAGICNNPKEYAYSNYKEVKNETYCDFVLVDTDEDRECDIKFTIDKFMNNNNICLDEFKHNEIMLTNIIAILKAKGVSLRRIANELELGRERVRKIYNRENAKEGDIMTSGQKEASKMTTNVKNGQKEASQMTTPSK